MARIELLEAATQSGRRYENGDAAAQRLGSQRALRCIRIDLDRCGAPPRLDVRSRAAATSAPAKFGMRPCGGNGKRATPSALSLSQTHRRAALLSAKPRAMTESGPARPGESQGSNPPQGKPPRSHRVAAFPPIGRERMLHAIGRAVARTQIQAEWAPMPPRGTEGSNPVPSSGESRTNHAFRFAPSRGG